MSTPATLFGIYFGIGLLVMIVAIASDKQRTLAKTLDPLLDANVPTAGVMGFIALLWPIWLIAKLSKE